jgi:membrane dipeptidase
LREKVSAKATDEGSTRLDEGDKKKRRREGEIMNRRQATFALAALAIAPQAAADAVPAVSARARALYARAIVVDANLAPPLQDTLPLPKAALDMTRGAGVTVMKTTLGGFNERFEDTVGEIALVQRTIDVHPDVFLQVRGGGDIDRAKREGRTGVIFSFEGVAMLDGKVDRIELFRDLGVLVMQVSYNGVSPFGAGVLADPAIGLTDLGHKAVASMNRLGVAVDLSHAGPRTTADAIAASTRPVLITHAGCAAVFAHPRNKTDAQLKAVADKGGVVGIYDLPYLAASPRQPDLDDYLAHMLHALKVCGEDHVGVGSDQGLEPFDTSPAGMAAFKKSEEQRIKAGIAAPGEDRPTYVVGLNTPLRSLVIADALLKRGLSERVVEKILGANFARAFKEIWVA